MIRGPDPMFSPFQEEHDQFRSMVRAFVEREIRPYVDQWEKDRLFPNELFRKAADLGTPGQIEEFLKPALRGEKVAALGVSEPAAGSDVAGILTVARKDGSDYVIDGQKTFITNGTRADFITIFVKTKPNAGTHGC